MNTYWFNLLKWHNLVGVITIGNRVVAAKFRNLGPQDMIQESTVFAQITSFIV